MIWAICIVATLAWGAFAFGGVYQWAYTPLAIAVAVLGIAGLLAPSRNGRRVNGRIALALALVTIAIAIQVMPIPSEWIAAVSPGTDAFLRQIDVGFGIATSIGTAAAHPLTLSAADTERSLWLFASLALFCAGLTRVLDGRRLRALLPGLVLLGVAVAIAGLVQRALFPGYGAKIYGFWTPEAKGWSFAPFINRNHFAGWMLMLVPLTFGYVAGLVMSDAPWRPNDDWRARVIAFTDRAGSQAMMTLTGALIMVLALIATLSRSGLGCFAAAVTIAAATIGRHRGSAGRRLAAVAGVAAVVAGSIVWTGADALAARLQDVDGTVGGRLPMWSDGWRAFTAFPWTGAGLNTYATVMMAFQSHGRGVVRVEQAHNDYLQLLTEGGLLVAIPAVLLIAVTAREAWNRFAEGLDDPLSYWVRVGAVTGLAAIGLQEMVEFSLQMPANAALFAVVCAIAVRKPTRTASVDVTPLYRARSASPPA